MTTNTSNTTSLITKNAMDVLHNNLVLVPRCNRTYEDEFKTGVGKIGPTVNVRIPGLGGPTGTGSVCTPAGAYDTYKAITVAQHWAALKFTSYELALLQQDEPEFTRSVLGPQMAKFVNEIDAAGFALYNQIPNHVGLPGTAPTDLQYPLIAAAQIAEFGAPVDDQVFGFLSPRTQASIVYGQHTYFNAQDELAQQYKKGVLGSNGGVTWMMSQNVATHTTGTWSGTPLMNGTTLEAATTLDINGFGGATDTFAKGDIITIAGVYAVNPISKISTGQLMQFRVTAATAAVSNEMTALPIDPPIYTSTSGPLQNVDALPLNDAVVQIFGHATSYATKTSPANIIMHRDALGFACVDMPIMDPSQQKRMKDPDLGVSIRVTKWLDGVNDSQLWRLDAMYGWAPLRERFACRLEG